MQIEKIKNLEHFIDSDTNFDFFKMLKTLEYSGIIDFKKQLKIEKGILVTTIH